MKNDDIFFLLFWAFIFGFIIIFYYRNKYLANRKSDKRETDADPYIINREPNQDELAIGWAEGEDDATGRPVLQLKAIPQEHRDKHMYVIGGSGSGKTKFLETIISQDIKNKAGFGVIDPHGDLTESIKGRLYLAAESPASDFLREKVVLIDPTDKNAVAGFNPLEIIRGIESSYQSAELVLAFKKIWEDSWGSRMEDLLRNSLIALIENELTLVELPSFLTDNTFRLQVIEKVEHPICQAYFNRFNSLNARTRDEWIESTMNKVNAFLSIDSIRAILSAPKSTFDLREIMDEGKVLLVKLDKGRLKSGAELLGSLLLSKIQMAAFSRTDMLESERKQFYLYIDEFQNFATENFIEMLSESRKYRLSLILAHQNLTQLPIDLRDSLLSNCKLHIYFGLARTDAQLLTKEALTTLYTSPPGWEDLIQLMQELKPRQFAAKNKEEGGAAVLSSITIDKPNEIAKMEAIEFQELVSQQGIGRNYLKTYEDIKKEHDELLKKIEEEHKEKDEEPQSFNEKPKQAD
ncbi:MAG: type IV secretion system DNA-binding domain-containing protein [bacterium]